MKIVLVTIAFLFFWLAPLALQIIANQPNDSEPQDFNTMSTSCGTFIRAEGVTTYIHSTDPECIK